MTNLTHDDGSLLRQGRFQFSFYLHVEERGFEVVLSLLYGGTIRLCREELLWTDPKQTSFSPTRTMSTECILTSDSSPTQKASSVTVVTCYYSLPKVYQILILDLNGIAENH